MAGPLSGVGAGQQIPVSPASQTTQNQIEQVREETEELQPAQETVQAENTQTAPVQENDTDVNQDVLRAQQEEVLRAANENEGETQRGSLIDITI